MVFDVDGDDPVGELEVVVFVVGFLLVNPEGEVDDFDSKPSPLSSCSSLSTRSDHPTPS